MKDKNTIAMEHSDQNQNILEAAWLAPIIKTMQVLYWLILQPVAAFTISRRDIQLVRSDLNNHRYIVTANHQSQLDPFLILAILPLNVFVKLSPVRFMAHNGLFKFPWQRLFFVSGGCFPARESSRYVFGIEGAKKFLHQRQTVLIFPEGKRVLYNTERPYNGISTLVSEIDSYIIPINLEWRRRKKYFQNCSIIASKPQPAAGKTAEDIMNIIYGLRKDG